MTDYVKSTNFTSKDALASGNPLKIVKGTEFDIEFNNIATAIATKADIINPALSGIPTAPTAAAGNNTTQLATTAFITTAIAASIITTIAAVKEALHPVGSIYTNASVSTNPGTLLGFGTWAAFGAGRVMVGFNAANLLFDTAEETGGSYDATLVSHTHTYSGSTVSAGTHTHTLNAYTASGSSDTVLTAAASESAQTDHINAAGDHTHTFSGTTASSGSSATNANIQPYITVYMWKRTA